MKKYLVFILPLLFSASVLGQQAPEGGMSGIVAPQGQPAADRKVPSRKDGPTWYIDGKRFDMDFDKVHISPARIEWLDVKKETPRGEVYVTLKSPLTTCSLADVLREHTQVDPAAADVLFMIGNKIVADTAGVRIDDMYYIYTGVQPLSAVRYLPGGYKRLVLVNVTLESEPRKPRIMIRGGVEELIETE